MSTIVTTNLGISEATVEQYCTADGLSLNAGGYAIRLYLNGGTTGYAILNSAAKEVLYPSSTAKPFQLDSSIRASRSSGTMSVELQFGGTAVHTESYTSTSLSTKTSSGITDSSVTNSTRDTEIRWEVKGSSTVSNFRVSTTDLTLYFYQYAMSANIGTGANGVQSVSVSNSVPYYGDSVTFSPTLINGATWDGWYSDADCTNLVSSSQSYTVSPSSDITLYAKATIEAQTYTCDAVAGENITSASVSDSIVADGDSCTFTATPSDHCTFDGWYSDSSYTSLISAENPYTVAITSDTILYAKGTKISYSISVGPVEHGTATVSANTAHYGDSVTFTFTPEDDTYELYGWYSDSEFTQLLSEDNTYTVTVTGNIILYPKIGNKRYTIKVGQNKNFLLGEPIDFDVIVVKYDYLSKEEKKYLRTGEYDNIDQNKIIERASASGSSMTKDVIVTVKCPYDAYVAIYAKDTNVLGDSYHGCIISSLDLSLSYQYIAPWPYYWCNPTGDTNFGIHRFGYEYSCDCSAVASTGIDDSYVTTPIRQEQNAIFTAEVSDGYTFSGWYSDEACTQLVSSDNPAYVATPKYTTENASATSLTLYAKATKMATGTGMYVKSNGSYTEVTAVYKKVDGTYVQQTNISELLNENVKYIKET